MTCVDWAKKLARAKRRRILAARRIKRICTSKFRGVLCFLQRTYVGVDGVPYSCTSGNLWGMNGSIQPLILRTSLKIEQHRRRLVRRKKMLRKRSFAPQNAGARSDGEKMHSVFSQPGTSTCGNQDLRKLSCGSRKMLVPTPSYRATTPSTHVNVSLIDSISSNSCADDFQKPSDFWATEKCAPSNPNNHFVQTGNNLELINKLWAPRFARARRKRILFQRKIMRLQSFKENGVINIRQRSFVCSDGVAVTCTSSDVWGTDGYTKYGFRPHGKIAQGRNRLERRKKMLRKRTEQFVWATHHNPRSVCRPSSSGVNSIYERSLINEHCPSESVVPDNAACNIETFDSRGSQAMHSLVHRNVQMHQLFNKHTRTYKPNNMDDIAHHRSAHWNFGPPKCTCSYCGAIVWYEERSEKSRPSSSPKFTICCQSGKAELPYFQECPPYLKSLLDYKGGKKSTHFREHIRMYNSTFAFTSMGGRVDSTINNGKGPYVFRLNGQNHHRIGSLLPMNDNPKFVQLYIYDTENETKNRMGVVGGCGKNKLYTEIVERLIQMFDAHNELTKVFRMARDRFKDSDLRNVTIKLVEHRHKDARQYNLPTASEIAGLLTCCEANSGNYRDVIVEEKSGLLKRINEKHPSFMAMQYPILFPYAEDGFRPNTEYRFQEQGRTTKRSYLTIREFYAFRIQQRIGEGWTLLSGGRLFQQFLVDAYTSVEEERFRWIKNNQKNIRSDLYRGLQDAVTLGDTSARCIGKRTILPSSFTGGPRYMVQNYQDAIAICRWGGSPDLFITFTCNSKWDEIRYVLDLIPGQRPEDRPDVVARVFKIKLNQLMHDIRKGKHFGRVLAAIYTIEFQKRGLPHAHILIFLHSSDKPKTPAQVDGMITAEVPNPKEDPNGYDSIKQFMIHGPCGAANIKSQCMIKGCCSKHYPKYYSDYTTFDEDGFPVYRRRNSGHYVTTTQGINLDNRWVIPHNLPLVVKYQAHINVELCNKVRSVKYLFKYINKGQDRATVIIEENNVGNEIPMKQVDEIKKYVDCRYIAASEACWRIFEFDIHYRKPAVERLQFHLPGEQTIIFRDDDNLIEVANRPNIGNTMFTSWMQTNECNVDARELTYVEFPTRWVWDAKIRKWKRRQRGNKIGRIYYAHPTSGERFYLRMLLNIIKGPTSYEDIRTVNGVVHNDFKSTCLALGLLEDDNEWDDALREAGHWSSPKNLREMFVTLLLFCELASPQIIWEKHWKILSDDVVWLERKKRNDKNLHLPEKEIINICLVEIEKIMNRNNRSLKEYPSIPYPDMTYYTDISNRLIMEELNYDCSALLEESERMILALNHEQREIFDIIIDDVQNAMGGFYFVYGSGGTGKTYLWKTIINTLRAEGKIVLPVATSGIAALLLPGGRTAHSRFKIPVNAGEESTCDIRKQSNLAQLIKNTSLIIWDEAPMVHRNSLEALERTLKDLMSNGSEEADSLLFGGKTVLLGGDFRQILPVIIKGTREMVVEASINKSLIWNKCKVFKLTTNMRLRNVDMLHTEIEKIEAFSNWVLAIGDGQLPAVSLCNGHDPTSIKIPNEFLIHGSENDLKNIVDSTYPKLHENMQNKEYLKDRCILAPTNDCVEEINSYVLSTISGYLSSYLSSDSISPISDVGEDQNLLFPTEFLNTIKLSGFPNHDLQLKVGVPVILLRNLNHSIGLCNGTRLIIKQLGSRVIEAEIISGSHVGKTVFLPRIVLTSTETKWPFILRRRQFPIKVCFGMTINKSQGQTLNNVGVYLPRPVFSHGQLYVAVSRTSCKEGLKFLIKNNDDEVEGVTENIVYKEVFDNL